MLLWYAAYGSNLSRERFAHYLVGGRPPGARQSYPGARDTQEPRADRPVRLPGRLHFGWESLTWGGGIAFLDPVPSSGRDRRGRTTDAPDVEGGPDDGTDDDVVLARAYLITAEQFADVASQEMRRPPGESLDLAPLVDGDRHRYGPGRYETVHRVGELDGLPVLTFTADDPTLLPPNPPGEAYLRVIVGGLVQSHRLGPEQVADYLLGAPTVAAAWTREDLLALAREGDGGRGAGTI